jgi:hypothetical protein
VDSDLTDSLLRQQCEWWGNFNVVQIAILTKCRNFIAEDACMNYVDQWWSGAKVISMIFDDYKTN